MSDSISDERERAIAYFEQLCSEGPSLAMPRVKNRSLRRLLEDFEEYALALPVHPHDTQGAVAKAAATRAI